MKEIVVFYCEFIQLRRLYFLISEKLYFLSMVLFFHVHLASDSDHLSYPSECSGRHFQCHLERRLIKVVSTHRKLHLQQLGQESRSAKVCPSVCQRLTLTLAIAYWQWIWLDATADGSGDADGCGTGCGCGCGWALGDGTGREAFRGGTFVATAFNLRFLCDFCCSFGHNNADRFRGALHFLESLKFSSVTHSAWVSVIRCCVLFS